MRYFRIQTNRVSIKRLLYQFKNKLNDGEYFVAPRPLPRQVFTYYYALACVRQNSENMDMVRNYKNCVEISKQDFEELNTSLTYKWSVRGKDAS